MSVSLKVKIFESSGTRILNVTKSTLTIGSASHCDIVLDDPSVAAEHTRAWLESGRIWIQDLGSSGGTALNDIRLPALKPMLVRDLDVLRLGESQSTLGLEAIAVRAPVVKPKVAEPSAAQPTAEPKGLSNVELERRREEAEALARELAELRLHLQMASLEKSSTEDISQQMASLREETKHVQAQRTKWEESVRQLDAERVTLRKSLDKEMADFKVVALEEARKTIGGQAGQQIDTLSGQIKKIEAELTTERQKAEAEKKRFADEKQAALERMAQVDAEKQTLQKSTQRELSEAKSKTLQEANKAIGEANKGLMEAKQAAADAQKQIADLKKELTEVHRHAMEAEKKATDYQKQFVEASRAATDTKKIAASATAVEKERKTYEKELAAFKADAVAKFTKTIQKMSLEKVRAWATRPLSQEMLAEWEADVVHAARRVVLNVDEPPPPRAKIKAEPPPALDFMAANAPTVVRPMPKIEEHGLTELPDHEEETREEKQARRARRKARAQKQMWRSVALATIVVAILFIGLWVGTNYMKSRGQRSLSSQAASTPIGPVKVASISGRPLHFQPKATHKYRNSYTDNVLYLENYVAAEENQDFHKRWVSDLNKVAGAEWRIDAWTLAPIAVEEQAMIQDLDNIKNNIMTDKIQEGLDKMHAREEKFMRDLDGVFKSHAGTERFLKFKRTFYTRNQAYLSRAN